MIRAFFSVLVDDPATFHAYMAKTLCDYEAYQGHDLQKTMSQAVLFHRGQALRCLQKQMRSPKVGYGFVTAIRLLITIDVCS